ncbi:MAG: GNAT family N-acetyltransferase [Clostridiales bacterium]|nr:GNAT family N-acetyltransferase [Clostridiales bacterium]
MAKIYLIRHCESEGNACRRTQAHVDALITVKGYEQNEMLRRRFKGIHIDAIYSSDSHRSVMTVEPIARERDLPVHVRISLREVTTGIWEDMAWGNIAKEYPEDNRTWNETPWAITTPGASSYQQVSDRLVFGLRRIANEVGENGTALVASHSCSIKAALCTILGKPMTEVKEMGHGDNTSVSLLNIDTAGRITVQFMNDASHLPERLQRAWRGVAGDEINMAVYPCRLPEQANDLLRLAGEDAAQRGEAFAAEDYLKTAEALLREHPGYIAFSYLKGELCGYVRLGTDENLPCDCGVMERIYLIPSLQNKGFGEQLFGYAAHELRYADKSVLAMRKDGSPEEKRVMERFVFSNMNGHPTYASIYLYCPPCPYPILA